MKVGFLLVVTLLTFNISRSQSPKSNAGTSAKRVSHHNGDCGPLSLGKGAG
jgi:hypothetical protein